MHSMLSRRIVAARPLTRTLVPAVSTRPQFTQIRARSTPAEAAELVDPNMVSYT